MRESCGVNENASSSARVRRRAFAGVTLVAILALIAAAAALLNSEDGSDNERGDLRYSRAFKILSPQGQAVRDAEVLRISMQVGACGLRDVPVLNIPLQVDVDDRREAVVVRVRLDFDYIETISPRRDDQPCAGINTSIERDVSLPRPIGRRALLNGGFDRDEGLPRVVLHSSVPAYRRALRSRADRLRYVGLDVQGNPIGG